MTEPTKPQAVDGLFYAHTSTADGVIQVVGGSIRGDLADANAAAYYVPYDVPGRADVTATPGTPEHAAIVGYLAAVAQLVEAIPTLIMRTPRREDAA